ncbi:MAG: hypothetical protein ACLFM6_01255 [Spirochaetaceae bacterium]
MYVTGWALHAVLDRVLHPYINYFSEPPDRRAFPRAHAFFERIVDVLLVRRRRGYEASTVDFDRLTDCGPEIPEDLQAMLAAGMRDAFERARTDDQLHPRLQNAYADARDFYRFTNTSGPETLEGALLRAETDRRRRALIALLHPLELPSGYDFANEGHAPWSHPCDEHEVRTTSLFELFDEAVDRGRRLAHGIHAGWEQRIPLFDAQTDAASPSVEALVGNHNLSDDRLLPCTKTCSDPFPLLEIADELCARYKRRK